MTLTDTGPLVALCDPRDARHGAAVNHLGRLAKAGLVVCEPVVTEACFHLTRLNQRERLHAVLDEFRIQSLSTHHADFHAEVFAWLVKYHEHDPDWADGCLAVLCGRDSRLKVWTFDRKFVTTWRRPGGKAIPMATRSS